MFSCSFYYEKQRGKPTNKQKNPANLKASYNQDETENAFVFYMYYAVPFPTNSAKLHYNLISPFCLNSDSFLEGAWLPHLAFILLAMDIAFSFFSFLIFFSFFFFLEFTWLTMMWTDLEAIWWSPVWRNTHSVCCDCRLFLMVCPCHLLHWSLLWIWEGLFVWPVVECENSEFNFKS